MHLLRLHGIHQRLHRYVPHHDYIPGPTNPIADAASRLFDLTDTEFLAYFDTHFPQKMPYKLVHLPQQTTSLVISALLRKMFNAASLTIEPPPVTNTAISRQATPISWASVPFSEPSKTRYQLYKSSYTEFDQDNLQPANIKSGLEQLKSTYGLLHRRTSP